MTKRFREILILSAGVMAWLSLSPIPGFAGSGEPVRLETFKTHSRLSFRVDEGVASDWKADARGFELLFKGIGLADLGAPLGDEDQWARRFQGLRDPRVADLEFKEVPGGLLVRGSWKFPQGGAAPARPAMEAFDYRDKAHASVVIDFWVKEGPTVVEATREREASRKLASARRLDEAEKARSARRAAREKARAEAEDPTLFCRAPLSEDGDVFLQFHPFHEKVDFARWLPRTAPDAGYEFREPKGDDALPGRLSREEQYVQLALKLYRKGDYALAHRTLDFFGKEFPRSSYRAEMRFLRANALFKLGMVEQAMAELRETLHFSPAVHGPRAGAVSLQAALFIVGRQLEAGDHVGALETFMWLSSRHGKSDQAWAFHLGAAESARALKQTDRAAKEYEWVASNGPDAAARAEGALRAGDLFMDRFQYDQALASYAQGIRRFDGESREFPAVHINRGEALYGLGQFDRAGDAFREFLTRFPGHPQGWRAAYRLGEIEARKPGATRESAPARQWYLETINRFPFSPGATLARMQLAPCADHGGLTAESTKRLYSDEAEAFDGSGQVVMDRFKDFRALSSVRTLMTLGQEEDAVAKAIDELKRVSRIEARRWLGSLLATNFRKHVLAMLAEGRKLEALTFYQRNEGVVPRTAPADDSRPGARVDLDYLLKLSQAASDLGLGKLAQEIGADYEKATKLPAKAPGRAIAGSPADEAAEDPEARLKASERRFTEAKALWMGLGTGAKGAPETESRIRAALAEVEAESRFSYEREIILGLLEERLGRPTLALRHALRAQVLGIGPRDARLDAWVASLEAKAGDPRAALTAYRALEARAAGPAEKAEPAAAEILGVPPLPARDALILAESEILEGLGRWGEAASNYTRAVEKGLGGSQALYGYARALLKGGAHGDRAKAIATLEKLSEGVVLPKPGAPPAPVPKAPDGAAPAERKPAASSAVARAEAKEKFWKRLASETLANERLRENAKEGMRP